MEIKAVKRGESLARLRDTGNPAGGCRATDPDGARGHVRRQMDQENFQGALHRMKPKFALLAALVAGLLPVAAVAQALPAAPQPAAPAATPPRRRTRTSRRTGRSAARAQAPVIVPPSAFPARIALIMFEYAVANTNEGQRAMADLQEEVPAAEGPATEPGSRDRYVEETVAGRTGHAFGR